MYQQKMLASDYVYKSKADQLQFSITFYLPENNQLSSKQAEDGCWT